MGSVGSGPRRAPPAAAAASADTIGGRGRRSSDGAQPGKEEKGEPGQAGMAAPGPGGAACTGRGEGMDGGHSPRHRPGRRRRRSRGRSLYREGGQGTSHGGRGLSAPSPVSFHGNPERRGVASGDDVTDAGGRAARVKRRSKSCLGLPRIGGRQNGFYGTTGSAESESSCQAAPRKMKLMNSLQP